LNTSASGDWFTEIFEGSPASTFDVQRHRIKTRIVVRAFETINIGRSIANETQWAIDPDQTNLVTYYGNEGFRTVFS
jgi:hypothetical protein